MSEELSKQEIIKLAAEIGARTAMDRIKQERLAERNKMKDRRHRNTKLLLENYRDFKMHSQKAVFAVEQATNAIDILELMWDPSHHSEAVIESIKKNAVKTKIIMAHVDAMLSVYQKLCQDSSDPADMRKYDTLVFRYISDTPMTCKEIAEVNHLEIRTVYRDLEEAIQKMECLIFGLDVME